MQADLRAANEDERQWGMYGHVIGLLAFTGIPFGGVVGPWVLYLQNKQARPFAAEQARNALNFHITIGIIQAISLAYAIVSWFSLFAVLHGYVVLAGVAGRMGTVFLAILVYLAAYVWGFVFTLIGTVRASQGVLYQYPLTWNVVR